jgi:hypothetical protein
MKPAVPASWPHPVVVLAKVDPVPIFHLDVYPDEAGTYAALF